MDKQYSITNSLRVLPNFISRSLSYNNVRKVGEKMKVQDE